MDFEPINRLRLKEAFGDFEVLEFIEFKANASNSSTDAIDENYHKAGEQLRTIVMDVKDRCAKLGMELTTVIPVEAHAVFNPTVPADNALKKSISANFILQTGVKLCFDNKKELR